MRFVMRHKIYMFFWLILVVLFYSASAHAWPSDEPVPDWLQQASKAVAPMYEKGVPAVVLRSEQVVTVAPDGLISTTTFEAIRLLRREGRGYAEVFAPYLQSSSKVRGIRAWLIKTDGT